MKQLKSGRKESQDRHPVETNQEEMKPETEKQETENETQDTGRNRHGILKNPTCRDLLFGNICYYILGQIIIVIFVNKEALLKVSLGFFIGVVLSVAMVIHMTIALEQAMCMGERGAYNHVRKTTAIRFAVIFIAFIVIGITKFCNILAALAGIMALKVSAYLQPFTHKVLAKKYTGKGR